MPKRQKKKKKHKICPWCKCQEYYEKIRKIKYFPCGSDPENNIRGPMCYQAAEYIHKQNNLKKRYIQ